MTVPFWLLGLGLLPGYVHHEYRVVARVGRHDVRGYAATAVRFAAVVMVLVGLVALAGTGPVAAAVGLSVIAAAWCAVVLEAHVPGD